MERNQGLSGDKSSRKGGTRREKLLGNSKFKKLIGHSQKDSRITLYVYTYTYDKNRKIRRIY